MINKSNISKIFSVSLAVAGVVLAGGHFVQADAQSRDPFAKPAYARPKAPVVPRVGKDGKPLPVDNWGTPSIEQRIDYYKRLRETAAANGSTLPKVTSVLTLNEMAVTGIFRTPRGYAAMVEATPIKLSYTIYPGEKFFDGQLVAVEENQLIFRKVTKTGPGKFASTVENKPLRKFTTRQELQGTAPPQTGDKVMETASNAVPAKSDSPAKPTVIVSPLDEMNKPATGEKQKSASTSKKPVKVARNNK